MYKTLYLFSAILIVMTGCASSSKNSDSEESYANLVTLEKPGETPNKPSKVYIDSVKQITADKRQVLLINGTFPDGCTKLESVTHSVEQQSLHLKLVAWRNPEMMCAEVLTPFAFIYDRIPGKELSSHTEVYINNSAYTY